MALPEWLMTFLLSTLLPWVISLMTAAVDKYLRPYVTQEGIDALTALFQKFLDDAIAAGRQIVVTFLVTVIGPIFTVTLVAPAPVEPLAGLKLLSDVAEEINGQGDTVPVWGGNNFPIDAP